MPGHVSRRITLDNSLDERLRLLIAHHYERVAAPHFDERAAHRLGQVLRTHRELDAAPREIVHARIPGVPEEIVVRVVTAVSRLREHGDLYKLPGVGETIVWAQALMALGDEGDLEDTLGAALKVHEDVERVRERKVLEGV